MMDPTTRERLRASGIAVDDYAKAMMLIDAEDELDPEEDPVEQFRTVIAYLNSNERLPSWLSSYCRTYGLDHIEMDLEPINEMIEV